VYTVIYYGNVEKAKTPKSAIRKAKEMESTYGKGSQAPVIAWGTLEECRDLRSAQMAARTIYADVAGDN